MATADNNRFLRSWWEVGTNKIGFNITSRDEASQSGLKWFPYNKGGDFRRWYGNNQFLVNWEGDGREIRGFADENGKIRSRPQNVEYFFRLGVTWTFISSSKFGVRLSDPGFLFDVAGSTVFPEPSDIEFILGLLCSSVAFDALKAVNPTLNFQVGNVGQIPLLTNFSPEVRDQVNSIVREAVEIARADWDQVETSWNFRLNIQKLNCRTVAHYIEEQLTVDSVRRQRLQELETLNNKLFLQAYGLQDEFSPDVAEEDISLRNINKRELVELLVSYSVGCMFGRYSLDKPGLILANQGETFSDYLKQIPAPSFSPDHDNVIPMLDGDWFPDDIVERFRKFLRVAFGEEHYEENLQFIEQALNIKDKSNYTIRDYFLGEFYTDHLKRYKKRPIYWLFSSPKGSFNALIYMHRYRPDTVSVVLNDYLREFRTKLTSRKSHLEAVSISANASSAEKTKALKDIDKNARIIAELEQYEREVMYPLATRRVEIDLDDGVKVNYPKFGRALRNIPGLDASEED
jgi:hypothetical protein